MTDENPLRAAHEAEQQEMQNELQSEAEYNEWVRGWKREDLTADLAFNHARTAHTLATAEYLHAKAALWSGLSVALGVVLILLVVAAIITGVKVIW